MDKPETFYPIDKVNVKTNYPQMMTWQPYPDTKPIESGYYLVTVEWLPETYRSFYHVDRDQWFETGVIAWMHLPKRYNK